MAKTCNQKAKILYLERMLWETGDTKALSMQEILEKLEGYGIHAERKSIYDDMEALRAFGMNVQYRRGSQGGYYLAERGENEEFAGEMFEKYNGDVSEDIEGTEVQAINQEEGEADTAVTETVENEAVETTTKHHAKKFKLLFDNGLRSEIENFLGNDAVYKEKEGGRFTATIHLEETPQLYGWLASLGRDVHILKPVKTAMAYRDYLKAIAKDYKGIEK